MRKAVFHSIVILLFTVLTVFPQSERKTVSQLPEIEPFKITKGSSFSASISHPEQKIKESSEKISQTDITADFSDALEIIAKNYVDDKTSDYSELAKSSITAMLRTLDPHSNYFDSAEFQNLLTEQNSEYFGIGATIVNYRKNGKYDTFVTSTFSDSPASVAGLRFGDRFLTVDGAKVSGLTSAVVRDKVRGRKGTVVSIKIERFDTKKQETFEIRRDRVAQPSIPDAYLLRDGVGYIDLSNGFNYTTLDELNKALAELHKQKISSLILDLRDNPGGILDQAVKVAEKFLPSGETIVSQRGRSRIDNRIWKSANKTAETLPLVVLVNNSSASASEIVAGAFQDSDRALIVGENTFGKGLVQSVFNLPNGSGLTLTTAKYYTPSGRSIQRDYSAGDNYDYFNHKTNLTETERNNLFSRTITGRKVFGGDGILPDEIVKKSEPTKMQIDLLDPLFFFAGELAAGKIKGFENYKIDARTIRYGQRIRPGDFPVSDELFALFTEYVLTENDWKLSKSQIESEKAFIKVRLRYNLATAAFGSVAANQVFIEDDEQTAKAIENLPRAEKLALTAKKTLLKRGK